jgi:hypothetical protein
MFQKLDLPPSGERREMPSLFGPLQRNPVTEVNVFYVTHHLGIRTEPVSKTLCSLGFRIEGDGKSPKTKWLKSKTRK